MPVPSLGCRYITRILECLRQPVMGWCNVRKWMETGIDLRSCIAGHAQRQRVFCFLAHILYRCGTSYCFHSISKGPKSNIPLFSVEREHTTLLCILRSALHTAWQHQSQRESYIIKISPSPVVFDFLVSVTVEISVFWGLTSCSLVDTWQDFEGIYYLRLQCTVVNFYHTRWSNVVEDNTWG